MSKKRSIWDEPCLCGCNRYPKRGVWWPGHDSTHKSRLMNRVRYYADWDAADELVRHGWLDSMAAVAEMVEGLARKAELTAPLR